jgi:exonuclease III
MGLCVEHPIDCQRKLARNSGMIPIANTKSIVGQDFGYIEQHLHTDCGTLSPVYQRTYQHGQPIGKNFSICSWNVFGLLKYTEHFLSWSIRKRMTVIIKTILDQDIDLICLQEVSTPVFKILYEKLHGIYYFYEETIDTEKTKKTYNRNLEILFLSKKPAQSYINYRLGGNLGYSNGLSILEFLDLKVFGCYLQAGSKQSVGQEYNWVHYSRCRAEQLEVIAQLCREDPHKAKIILGDMNFHLDGSAGDWPEIQQLDQLKEIGFIDSYRSLFPSKLGLTEDTDVNYMRYNAKFMDKRFRYDGILSLGLKPVDCVILGTEQIELTDEEIAEMLDVFVYKKDASKIRVNQRLALWPSDHFGIMTIFG